MASSDGSVVIDILGKTDNFRGELGKLGSLASTAMKSVAVGAGAAVASVGALTKSAIESYSSYEQLAGGVETLFKDSAKTVKDYADNAYKTSGLSANEYMETVTSFAASLLQGLGGDTEEAAKMADVAITDMSDNANKMGTDMASIQYAYQGFAKQNYTMLDNLKLGYGGTQAEMARLINDSGVLGDTIDVTAKTVNNVSFDKIIEAIHVVQERMGITGTTALEAATTIEGSVNSAKAAWTNLVTGLGNENADLDRLVKELIESASTAAGNVIPRIEQILKGVGNAFDALAEQNPLLNALWETIKALTTAVEFAAGAFVAFKAGMAIQGIVQGYQEAQVAISLLSMEIGKANLAQAAVNGAMTIGQTIVALWTGQITAAELATAALTKAQALLNVVMNANPIALVVTAVGALVAGLVLLYNKNEKFREGVINAWNAIKDTVKGVIDWFLHDLLGLPKKAEDSGKETAEGIARGLNSGSCSIESASNNITDKTEQGFSELPGMAENAGRETASGFADGLEGETERVSNASHKFWKASEPGFEDFKKRAKKMGELSGKNVADGLRGNIYKVTAAAKETVDKLKENFDKAPIDANKSGSETSIGFAQGLRENDKDSVAAAQKIVSETGRQFSGLSSTYHGYGKSVVDGFVRGIEENRSRAISAGARLATDTAKSTKKAAGINSPSKLFSDDIGRWIPPGIGKGIEKAMPALSSDINKELQWLVDDANLSVAAEVGGFTNQISVASEAKLGSQTPQTITNDNGITIPVTVNYYGNADPTDVKKISRQIGVDAAREMRRRGVLA